MTLCDINRVITNDVLNFMINVPNVGEESITDYLIWKWKEADNRFNYIKTKKFTKEEENKETGADFEIELWLIGDLHCIPLIVQAKKIIPNYGGYCGKLNYPNGTQDQMKTLLEYASINNRLAVYFFYSVPEVTTNIVCNENSNAIDHACGIYISDSSKVQKIANTYKGKKLSRDRILENSTPLDCLFCCNNGGVKGLNLPPRPMPLKIFSDTLYFPKYDSNNLPTYVKNLLTKDLSLENREYSNKFQKFRYIATYDIRYENQT